MKRDGERVSSVKELDLYSPKVVMSSCSCCFGTAHSTTCVCQLALCCHGNGPSAVREGFHTDVIPHSAGSRGLLFTSVFIILDFCISCYFLYLITLQWIFS